MVKRALLLGCLAACGKFEDPAIVLDLRPIAIEADLPEQVVNVDLNNPPAPDQVLAQLVDTNVYVLLSDRNFDRRIRWKAELCNINDAERCDHESPYELLGSGVWEDPDTGVAPTPEITIPADGNLLGILFDELQNDTLHGLGGIYYGVSLQFGGEDADPALDQFAAKTLGVQPAIPFGRTPNQNPTIDHIDASIGDDLTTFPVPVGSCEQITPWLVSPGEKLHLQPVEYETTRETYSVPTIDGMSRTFTEAVTYQWLSTDGKWSDTDTGGGHDTFGNQVPVDTFWTAPDHAVGNVPLWIIVRDERLGVTWYQSCVNVQE